MKGDVEGAYGEEEEREDEVESERGEPREYGSIEVYHPPDADWDSGGWAPSFGAGEYVARLGEVLDVYM